MLILSFEYYNQNDSFLDEMFYKIFEIIMNFDHQNSRDFSNEIENLKSIFEKNSHLINVCSVVKFYIFHL